MIVQVITVRLVQTQNHGNLRWGTRAPVVPTGRRTTHRIADAHTAQTQVVHHVARWDTSHISCDGGALTGNLVLFLVDSCIPARQWTDICNMRCSILSRFSHFHVSHFPPLQVGAAKSCLAFSTAATWCRIFMSRNFMSRIFSVPPRGSFCLSRPRLCLGLEPIASPQLRLEVSTSVLPLPRPSWLGCETQMH